MILRRKDAGTPVVVEDEDDSDDKVFDGDEVAAKPNNAVVGWTRHRCRTV